MISCSAVTLGSPPSRIFDAQGTGCKLNVSGRGGKGSSGCVDEVLLGRRRITCPIISAICRGADPEREARRRQYTYAAEQGNSLRPFSFILLISRSFAHCLGPCLLGSALLVCLCHGLSPRRKLRPDKQGDFLVLSTLAHGSPVWDGYLWWSSPGNPYAGLL